MTNVVIKQYKSLEDSNYGSYQELMLAICLNAYCVRYDSKGRVIRPKTMNKLPGIRMVLNQVDPAWDIFFPMINIFNHRSMVPMRIDGRIDMQFEIQDQSYFGRKKYPGFFELADIFCQQITPIKDGNK